MNNIVREECQDLREPFATLVWRGHIADVLGLPASPSLTSMQKELRKIFVAIESIHSRSEIDEVKRTVYGPLVLTLYHDPQIV